MILLVFFLGAYAWGGSHAQDWNCLGPQPAVTAACNPKHSPGWPDERR